MRFTLACAAVLLASAGPASALTIVGENEPNNSIAEAQFLTVDSFKPVQVVGSLETATTAFVDFFGFDITCPTGVVVCRAVSLAAVGLNGENPIIGLFNFNGENLLQGSQGSLRSATTISYLYAGRYTAAVRRDSAYTASNYTLFIDTTGAVPEPAAWLMMLAGFGMVGTVMRAKARPRTQFA